MDLLERMADLYQDPMLAIWSFLSLPAIGVLLLLTWNNPIGPFYVFLALCAIAWLVAAPTVFKDTAHASIDWEEEVNLKKVLKLSAVGVLALLVIGFAFSAVFLGRISVAIWVPGTLAPLAVTSESSGFTILMVNLFATTFAVVPGEESGKAIFTVLFRAYHNAEWADKLPFVLQPAVLAGGGFWSAEHLVAGQYVMLFAVTVFISSLVMNELAARSGTYLTSWLIHLGYNSIILILAFISQLMRI